MIRALAILAPVLWLLMPAGTPEEDVADYVDIAASARLTARTVIGGETTKEFILESTGGGVALLDYDGDGWTDIFLVNGSRIGGFPGGEEPTNRLYRNNHDGTFTDVTAKAGLVRHGWGQGACAGDYNAQPIGEKLAASLGLEPRQTDPESVVLPLHHEAVVKALKE